MRRGPGWLPRSAPADLGCPCPGVTVLGATRHWDWRANRPPPLLTYTTLQTTFFLVSFSFPKDVFLSSHALLPSLVFLFVRMSFCLSPSLLSFS